MATNLTKGKTKKAAATVKQQPPDANETVAAIANALRPSALSGIVDALTAAVGTAAASAVPKPAKPATPLHKFPVVDDEAVGGSLLLTNVMYAKALGTCPIEQEQVVMSHDQYGVITLRMVEYSGGGFLIGIIDRDKATYAECEHFHSKREAMASWPAWLEAAAM